MSDKTYTKIIVPVTQISEINKQYQKLDTILNTLVKSVALNCEDTKISEIFYSLMHLHSHHFVQEQITLAKYNFKDLCKIKAIHKSFLGHIINLQEKIAKEPNKFCNEMIDFLTSWSESYFVSNQEAITFLESKGVK